MSPHLYIHVPFCISKCSYCAFYSIVDAQQQQIASYPELISREIKLRCRDNATPRPKSIYIGGGTPSLLGTAGFTDLADQLHRCIDFTNLQEWSVELNPESTTRQLLQTLRLAGVNRLTLGVQSFHDSVLLAVNRPCSAACCIDAVQRARSAGFNNIGIDLIAGLPGVTMTQWLDDLGQAIALEPMHISVYTLSIEPGTKLARQVKQGLSLPDDTEQMDFIETAEDLLAQEGFNRYEISNYARPGFECRHNLGIWRGDDYHGVGPSAVSRFTGMHRENASDFKGWQSALRDNLEPPHTIEELTALDDAIQRTLFQLRLRSGINLEECVKKHPVLQEQLNRWQSTLNRMRDLKLVINNQDRYYLTRRGREVCDSIIRELL